MNRIRNMLNIDYIHRKGYTGKDIGIAILDTGIARHQDIIDCVSCFRDYINERISPYDDNGHGTHVSGIIAGNGRKSAGKYKGIAPGARIVMLKCLDAAGNGSVIDAKKSFDFILNNREKFNIRIVNISVGSVMKSGDMEYEILLEYVEHLWKAGFVVVAAAGNNGPKSGSITAPGCAKSIITVGASDDNIEVNSTGRRKMINYSGRGPTDVCVVKPEIVCPGTGIVSCDGSRKTGYSSKSGTSMAAPIVSGVIALMLQKYPELSNKEIKKRLYETAIDIGQPKSHQGWGQINPLGLLEIRTENTFSF